MKKRNIGQIEWEKKAQTMRDQRPIQEAIEEFICFKIKWNQYRFIRTLYNLISSIPFVIKCYSQILWIPKIIKGYEYLLSAEKQWHQHYKKIAEHKAQQVVDIMENTVADYVPEEDMKRIYQRWDFEVPDKYMTQEDHQKWFDDHYDHWLCNGGVGELDHIYWEQEEGKKLLDGFNIREEI